MMMNYAGAGSEHSIALYTLNTVFKHSRKIFEKYPTALIIEYNFIEPKENRDKYGNVTSNENENLITMKLFRSTAQKINWKYANDKLGQVLIGGDYKELILMLDGVSGIGK
jgi:hypothetical protein